VCLLELAPDGLGLDRDSGGGGAAAATSSTAFHSAEAWRGSSRTAPSGSPKPAVARASGARRASFRHSTSASFGPSRTSMPARRSACASASSRGPELRVVGGEVDPDPRARLHDLSGADAL